MCDAEKVEKVKEGLAACFMIDGTCSTCPYFAECYPLQGQSKRGVPYKDTVALIDGLAQEIEQLKQRPDVVRCKDCKHQNWINAETGCIVCKFGRGTNAPDWYCADGERKDGDGDAD